MSMTDASDRCLIVEDNLIILMDLEDIVKSAGFTQVDRAANLSQAMALVESTHYRFAFLDFDLEGDSCLPLVKALRKRKTPFAITTGYSDRDLPKLLEGAPIVSKPFSEETIKKILLKALKGLPIP
jgi:ActR/RegA family two-component response regulator